MGFPGETPEIFAELLAFWKNDRCFDKVAVFAYSESENAPANQLDGRVDRLTRAVRWKRLCEVLGDRCAVDSASVMDEPLSRNFFAVNNLRLR